MKPDKVRNNSAEHTFQEGFQNCKINLLRYGVGLIVKPVYRNLKQTRQYEFSIVTGLENNLLSGSLEQLDFLAGKVTFTAHLPNGPGFR